MNIISNDEIDYLNLSYKPEYISFMSLNRIKSLTENDDIMDNRFRQHMKFGRFFKKYSIFDPNDLSEITIEKISNTYKSVCDNILNESKIEIVSGKKIGYWYSEDNYSKNNGTLNNSCMKYYNFGEDGLFTIYQDNPNVCKLLIKKDPINKSKIVGRALLWKTNLGFFMDRIYTSEDSHKYSFLGFCKKNGWLSKDINSNLKLEVQLKNDYYGSPSNNPYLDTFKYYDFKNNKLLNYKPLHIDYEIFDSY
jgi:hypothetical protein